MAKKMEPGAYAYLNGAFVPSGEANISIMTHAFNYGTALFEGIRGYRSEDNNVLIFRLKEHIDRLARNFNILHISIPESRDDMERICVDIVKKSGFREGVYIRPIGYKSECSLGPKLHDVESAFCCYIIKLGDYVDTVSGLDVAVSSWRRLGDNSIPSRAKSTGSYINSSLASTEAKLGGFDEAIFLRENGTVAEGSAMNLFMVLDGKLITSPPTDDILVGITRNTVIELARNSLRLEVIERPISRTELYVCDELFFTGTGAQVAPVRSVDRRVVGSGEPGPVSKRLQDLYFDVVMGKVPGYAHWCTPVY
ncbi:MAG: putative branched-chain-amino-acid aminotransferase [Candidatus Hydrogenedentota bacterium]